MNYYKTRFNDTYKYVSVSSVYMKFHLTDDDSSCDNESKDDYHCYYCHHIYARRIQFPFISPAARKTLF